jgi:hypothetical protein
MSTYSRRSPALIRIICSVFGWFLASLAIAHATSPIYGIYWLSNPAPCLGNAASVNLHGPVTSTYFQGCTLIGIKLSFCRNSFEDSDPWASGLAITIVGYSLSLEQTSSTSNGSVIIGESGGSIDVFGHAAGVGSFDRNVWFPTGQGISLPPASADADEHFDVYAACDTGSTYSVRLSVYYTSP